MAEWAVLFVHVGSEGRIVKQLSKSLNGADYAPFIPTKVKDILRNGKVERRETVMCFPGYVFIGFNVPVDRFFREVCPLASVIGGSHYFAYYGDDKKDIVMRREEREALERLMNGDYCIDASKGFLEGGKVRVTEGALLGMDGRIKKVFRNKRIAVVEMPFMGGSREITLALEILKEV